MICNGVGLLFVLLWMSVVFVVRSVHRTGEQERGERGEGEERLFFYPLYCHYPCHNRVRDRHF